MTGPMDAPLTGQQRPSTPGLAKLLDELSDAVTFDYKTGGEGYQQSADAMWKAAVAAFDWAAREVGATGFQASWAALQFYAKAMHVDGPFTVVKVEDALYPQYDLTGRVASFIDEQRDWLRDEARKKLAGDTKHAAPEVLAHWRKLASA